MKKVIKKMISNAKKCPGRIVFPEADEARVLKAAVEIVRLGIGKPILIGNVKKTEENLRRLRLSSKGVEIIDQLASPNLEKYAKRIYRLRKAKGWSLADCRKKIKERIYFATMMVHSGDADGLISGSVHSTGDTLRPALQLIKKKKGWVKASKHDVSAVEVLVDKLHQNRLLFFADCAITIDPTAEQLAEIAIDAGLFAKQFGLKPKVALLSFSTKGSAQHPFVVNVRKAATLAQKIVKNEKLGIVVDGEYQLDAALEPSVALQKAKRGLIKGDANVLIFPDLQAANIGIKLVQRLAGDQSIGPITMGLSKPINDLSRGCGVEEIVTLAAITSLEAPGRKFL